MVPVTDDVDELERVSLLVEDQRHRVNSIISRKVMRDIVPRAGRRIAVTWGSERSKARTILPLYRLALPDKPVEVIHL